MGLTVAAYKWLSGCTPFERKFPLAKNQNCLTVRLSAIREEGKIRKRTLANLSKLPDTVVDNLRIVLKGGTAIENPSESFSVERSLLHGHVAAVLGTIKKLDLHNLIAPENERKRALVLAMIVARLLDPRSKLATARGLNSETCFSSLSGILGLEKADEDELYEAMDWLVARQESIENELAKIHLKSGALVLYDVSSTYERRNSMSSR